jgi:hypothetical protein
MRLHGLDFISRVIWMSEEDNEEMDLCQKLWFEPDIKIDMMTERVSDARSVVQYMTLSAVLNCFHSPLLYSA